MGLLTSLVSKNTFLETDEAIIRTKKMTPFLGAGVDITRP